MKKRIAFKFNDNSLTSLLNSHEAEIINLSDGRSIILPKPDCLETDLEYIACEKCGHQAKYPACAYCGNAIPLPPNY